MIFHYFNYTPAQKRAIADTPEIGPSREQLWQGQYLGYAVAKGFVPGPFRETLSEWARGLRQAGKLPGNSSKTCAVVIERVGEYLEVVL